MLDCVFTEWSSMLLISVSNELQMLSIKHLFLRKHLPHGINSHKLIYLSEKYTENLSLSHLSNYGKLNSKNEISSKSSLPKLYTLHKSGLIWNAQDNFV